MLSSFRAINLTDTLRFLMGGVFVLLLSSCGGGGGGGSASTTSTTDSSTPSSSTSTPPTNSADSAKVNASTVCAEGAATTPNDISYSLQWLINNISQLIGSTTAYDLNLQSWRATCTGEGVRIAVSDSGIQADHEDLLANIGTDFAFDYTRSSSTIYSPTRSNNNNHGTNVAGLIAMVQGNAQGGVGIAPLSKVYRYVLVSSSGTSNSAIAESLIANMGKAYEPHIYTASWGITDGENNAGTYSQVIDEAVTQGVKEGRGGLGRIYLWAAGNGYADSPTNILYENSNLDPYPAHPDVFAICSVDNNGVVSYFSEPGENLLVCGFGSSTDSTNKLFTTDVYSTATQEKYRSDFSGTSAATPTVAGVVALMLQANQTLTWREVREILARTARKSNSDSGWRSFNANGNNYNFHTRYGFGVVDGGAAIRLAKQWNESGWKGDGIRFSGPSALSSSSSALTMTQGQTIRQKLTVSGSGINFLESVRLKVTLEQPKIASLSFSIYSYDKRPYRLTLISPSGRESPILSEGDCESGCEDIVQSRFTSHAFWGEKADGEWTIKVEDTRTNTEDDEVGKLYGLKIEFHGH